MGCLCLAGIVTIATLLPGQLHDLPVQARIGPVAQYLSTGTVNMPALVTTYNTVTDDAYVAVLPSWPRATVR
jgi:hypothetical protein